MIGITTKNINWEESIIGYIVDINKTYITINELDEFGLYIGNTVVLIKDILHVEPDNWYIRNLRFIHEKSSNFDPNQRMTIWKEKEDLISYFETLREKKKILRLFLKMTIMLLE